MRFLNRVAPLDAVTFSGLPSLVGAGTVEFYVRPDLIAGLTHHLWGNRVPDAETIIRIMATGKVNVIPRTAGAFLTAIDSAATLLTGGPAVHVAWVVDGTSGRLFIDGALDTSSTLASAVTVLVPATGLARVGNYVVGEPADASIRDVRLWNRALMQAELAPNRGPLRGSEQGLVAWWPLVDDVRDYAVKPLGSPRLNGTVVGSPRFQLALQR